MYVTSLTARVSHMSIQNPSPSIRTLRTEMMYRWVFMVVGNTWWQAWNWFIFGWWDLLGNLKIPFEIHRFPSNSHQPKINFIIRIYTNLNIFCCCFFFRERHWYPLFLTFNNCPLGLKPRWNHAHMPSLLACTWWSSETFLTRLGTFHMQTESDSSKPCQSGYLEIKLSNGCYFKWSTWFNETKFNFTVPREENNLWQFFLQILTIICWNNNAFITWTKFKHSSRCRGAPVVHTLP